MTPKTSEIKMMSENESLSSMQKFYSGSNILITGATGFMGKCLVEKLLRSCPDIENIYILIREKRGKSASDRIQQLFQDSIFSQLKEKTDKLQAKVIAISGDVSSPGLGISLSDRCLLQKQINIVFHVAATVNFNEKLKMAFAINIIGTQEMLQLCKEMDKLKAVVHVSTVYSNCHLKKIEEKFYKYPISYKELSAVLEKLDDKAVEELTPRILGNWPNTYTFTKAMAEKLIQEEKENLPLAIFRPAIIVSTWKEPVQGWIDNIYGPNGICAGALMGVLGSLRCDASIPANIVPVDMTINALLACAWNIGMKKTEAVTQSLEKDIHLKSCEENYRSDYVRCGNNNNEIGTVYQTSNMYMEEDKSCDTDDFIYNYISTTEKPITWGEYCGINMIFADKYPLKNAIWCINFGCTNSNFLHSFNMIMFHLFPALFFDAVSILLGKKARLFKIYRKTEKFTSIVQYFCSTEWQFTNYNVQKLWHTLDSKDKQIFPFSMSEMNWLDYFRTYIHGMRKYLYKEDDSTIPEAERKRFRFQIVSFCTKALLFYFFMHTLFYILRTVVNKITFY